MDPRWRMAAAFLVLLFGAAAPIARGQQACPAPAALPQASGNNIFSIQQEIDLGDAMAEHLQHDFRVIDDEEVTAYLASEANRMASQLPAEHLQMKVFLIDIPVLNAFSIAGGRIYVARKMAGFLRRDDELAGLLGHEMGHILSRQVGVEMSERFRAVLGVTQVTDRKDIFARYNQLLDNYARQRKVLEKQERKEEPNQYQADRIALIAMSNAGYDPHAFVEFFDRLAETHGKMGNWFTDLFGAAPEQKRLRVMHRALSELPAGCAATKATAASKEFLEWQSGAVGYAGLNRREVVRGIKARKSLLPPLRTDVIRLKFSMDGQYALAQDDSSVYVLSREPFQVLFRIPAEDAAPAQFSPDSESVVFHTRGLHVEQWNIAEEKRTGSREFFIRSGCRQTALSPDGRTMACLQIDYKSGSGIAYVLSLYDAGTGEAYFTRKNIFAPHTFADVFAEIFSILLGGQDTEVVRMRFSPDGRYFLAARRGESLAMDLSTHAPVSLHGTLRAGLGDVFAFLDSDRVVRINPEDPKKSSVVSFPSGTTLKTLTLGGTRLDPATHGNTLIVGPLKDAPTGAIEMDTQKVVVALKKSKALDFYDQQFMSERYSGDIGLYDLSGKAIARAHLPESLLGKLKASAASPDLQWLALSGGTRGAVWNLSTGARAYYLRGFRGAYFDDESSFYAEFPKQDEEKRSVARADLRGAGVTRTFEVGEKDATNYTGRLQLIRKPAGKEKDPDKLWKNVLIEAHDIRDGKTLWTRTFPEEAPVLYADDSITSAVLSWPLNSDAAKGILKAAPDLRERGAKVAEPGQSYLLEAVDPATGAPRGRVIVDTGKGSFHVHSAYAAGDNLAVADSQNRVIVYSLANGQQVAKYFGSSSTISERSQLLCVENEPGQLNLYDLKSQEKKESYTFGYRIAYAQFSSDGQRLLIVTTNQKAYVLDVSGYAGTP